MKCFIQSYEGNTLLDASILIAPLVFFVAPNDPRFLNTMDRILLPLEKGGLTSAGLVHRYDTEHADDGTLENEENSGVPSLPKAYIYYLYPSVATAVETLPHAMMYNHPNWRRSNRCLGVGGDEGAFSMCTFWLVEAMTRASVYEPRYRARAINLFENVLSFSNHVSMFSEEIARTGEQLGNTPQAFSHLALISAAFNLDRVTQSKN